MKRNKFPIYIVSYGRYDKKRSYTANYFLDMGMDFKIVVEPEQAELYRQRFGDKVLVVPKEYHDNYEDYDDLGQSKSQGPGPARNFAWEHSIQEGHKWHWVMDDNIQGFYVYNNNREIIAGDMSPFICMEEFVERFENIAMAGPNYYMFVARKRKYHPYIPNTRIYSCNLIRNDLPFRWRGRYNEDTDLSLCILKSGLCTVLFNMFLQQKTTTQHTKGGNTERFYSIEGTYPKTEMLKRMHPNNVRLVYRFRRWHHRVDYSMFNGNRFKLKSEVLPWQPPKLVVTKLEEI